MATDIIQTHLYEQDINRAFSETDSADLKTIITKVVDMAFSLGQITLKHNEVQNIFSVIHAFDRQMKTILE